LEDEEKNVTLIFENETDRQLEGVDMQALAMRVCETALDEIGCPFEAQISLTITDSEGIRQINREFREIDAATDVLSFPVLEFDEPGSFDELLSCIEAEESDEAFPVRVGWLNDPDDCFDPDTGELELGDIVINLDRVCEQARAYGHSEMREYAFLLVHSILHLCGYDHMQPDEAEQMEAQQEMILQSMGITREKI